MSIKTIIEIIFQIEEEMDLFNKQIGGVYFWELIRFNVIGDIAKITGLYGQAHTELEKDMQYFIKKIINASKNIFYKNPFLVPKSDLLFIGHPRRKLLEDGLWWDVYCDPIIEYLKNTQNCLLFENSYLDSHLTPARTKQIRHLDLPHTAGITASKAMLAADGLKNNEKSTIKELEEQLQKKFHISISLGKLITAKLNARKTMAPIYAFLLKKVSPKAVVLVVSYGHEVFIETCKNLKIPTIELQHGTISRYHAAYSFPGYKAMKRCFPDYFLSFGDYWKKLVDFPLPDEKIYSVGYPFFEMETGKYCKCPKQDQITFISQGTIGDKLSKFAVELKARQDLQMDIVYKLHPGEYARWKQEYPWLVNAGVRVIDDESEQLYKLLAQTKVLIGVYSTVVYEGLGMGLRTFLVDLPGIEYMNELIASRAAVKVSSVDELLQQLSQPSQLNVKGDHFFKPNALKNISHALDEIVQRSGTKS